MLTRLSILLRHHRRSMNISQRQLGLRLQITKTNVISEYERGRPMVKVSTIWDYATALGLDPVELATEVMREYVKAKEINK